MALAVSGDQPIRDAATIVLVRHDGDTPRLLMGQRPQRAAFLPGAWVFPGGAVEAGDALMGLSGPPGCMALLQDDSTRPAEALIAAGLRELFEETGLVVGRSAMWTPPDGASEIWATMAAMGAQPDGAALQYFARAITPAGRPRRFDARFFWADATALAMPADRLQPVENEFQDLAWVSIAQTAQLPLAFITRLIVEEVAALIARGGTPSAVPIIAPGGQGGVIRHHPRRSMAM